MKSKGITDDIQKEIDKIIHEFNKTTLGDADRKFVARIHGKHLYLDFYEYGKDGPRCRLTYSGKMDNWDFAIFKYSSETYSKDWMFPGSEHIDGTVVGAMKAALEVYS